MNPHQQEQGHYGFIVGLLTGTAIGAGLAMWLAPRGAAELGQRLTDSARSLAERASDRYRQTSARVGDAVDDLTRKGQGVRDDLTRKGQDVRDNVAGAVARGAHEVETYATAAMSDRR